MFLIEKFNPKLLLLYAYTYSFVNIHLCIGIQTLTYEMSQIELYIEKSVVMSFLIKQNAREKRVYNGIHVFLRRLFVVEEREKFICSKLKQRTLHDVQVFGFVCAIANTK